MNSVFFFKKNKIQVKSLYKRFSLKKNFIIKSVTSLDKAKKHDLTFFDSVKYKTFAKNTRASACITTEKLKRFLPKNVEAIIVNNVLFELAKVLSKIYSNAEIDYPDLSLKIQIKNFLNL